MQTLTKSYEKHLHRIKNEGIQWVRIEAGNDPVTDDVIKFACQIGLDVIVILRSKTALQGTGLLCENYVPLFDWGKIWEDYVKQKVQEFKSLGIRFWQVDNELNHPGHNPIPSADRDLRKDIIRIGANAIKSSDPDARIMVNLFSHSLNALAIIQDIVDYRFLRDAGVPIHILGMDYYRGSWDIGDPLMYPLELTAHQAIWGGDMMIMETGFSSYPDNTEERVHQTSYVREIFQYLEDFFKMVSWFKGLVFYEYKSNHADMPVEDYFGLHYEGGLEADSKPAWDEFVKQIRVYNEYSKILGITYHL